MHKFRSYSFSHILFSINSKTGHSGLPGESLQGSFSQMTGWPSAYVHWGCSVCLLDRHWAGLHLPRKEGTWKARSSSLNGLVMLVLLRTRILAPTLICTASLSAQQILDVPRLYPKSDLKGKGVIQLIIGFVNIFVLGTRYQVWTFCTNPFHELNVNILLRRTHLRFITQMIWEDNIKQATC